MLKLGIYEQVVNEIVAAEDSGVGCFLFRPVARQEHEPLF
jgi:hypothetical protein